MEIFIISIWLYKSEKNIYAMTIILFFRKDCFDSPFPQTLLSLCVFLAPSQVHYASQVHHFVELMY